MASLSFSKYLPLLLPFFISPIYNFESHLLNWTTFVERFHCLRCSSAIFSNRSFRRTFLSAGRVNIIYLVRHGFAQRILLSPYHDKGSGVCSGSIIDVTGVARSMVVSGEQEPDPVVSTSDTRPRNTQHMIYACLLYTSRCV